MAMRPPRSSSAAPVDVSKIVSRIRSKFGADAVFVPGREPDFMLKQIANWVDVGPILNPVFGSGAKGLACGYYVELAGAESAGKTTLGYHLLGVAQQAGCVALLGDIEHSYDQDWAAKQGVDNSNLIIIPTMRIQTGSKAGQVVIDNVNEIFSRFDSYLRETASLGLPIVLLADSLAAMLPKQWLDGDYGNTVPAPLAGALAKCIPKFQATLIATNTCCVFVNQLRDKIGVMFGEKETTVGGRAKNYYFFARVSIKREKTVKKGDVAVGIISKVKNKKNKLDKPFRAAQVYINFDTGLSTNIPVKAAKP